MKLIKLNKPSDSIGFNRRLVLKGLGGVMLGLPLLESLGAGKARAQSAAPNDTYAIFFNQANGVQCEGNGEPERFWPSAVGPLTDATMAGRAVDELTAHRQRLLVLRNVNMEYFDFADGHAAGAMQTLTARPPVVLGVGPDSEASGESIDHRIGAELNPDGRDSLFFHAGAQGGWLNGACISYRAANTRRTAINNAYNGYQNIVGIDGGTDPVIQEQLRARVQSVNDLVRDHLNVVLNHPRLSQADRTRIDLHLAGVRDLEINLGCRMATADEQALEAAARSPSGGNSYDVSNGDEVLEQVRLMMDVAVLAVGCGYTRSVAIQVGQSNDATGRYRNLDTGELMENYHYLSHRQATHGSDPTLTIAGADVMHHMVDRHFARAYNHLLDRLAAAAGADGGSLLERGLAIWHNDNGNGPGHDVRNVPWILAGGCAGFLKQGEMLELENDSNNNTHARLLNTIASAVGVRKSDGNYLDDFGDPSLPGGILDEMLV